MARDAVAAMTAVPAEAASRPSNTFRAVIDAHACAQPRAPFLIAPEPAIELDYATLRSQCNAFGALLEQRGSAG